MSDNTVLAITSIVVPICLTAMAIARMYFDNKSKKQNNG